MKLKQKLKELKNKKMQCFRSRSGFRGLLDPDSESRSGSRGLFKGLNVK